MTKRSETLPSFLAGLAEGHGEETALICEGELLTFGEAEGDGGGVTRNEEARSSG